MEFLIFSMSALMVFEGILKI